MKLIKKHITDVYVQRIWSSQWRRDKYVVWMTYTKTLLGIKFMENTEVSAIFDTKQEARKHAKRMRHKYNVPKKYNQAH